VFMCVCVCVVCVVCVCVWCVGYVCVCGVCGCVCVGVVCVFMCVCVCVCVCRVCVSSNRTQAVTASLESVMIKTWRLTAPFTKPPHSNRLCIAPKSHN